MDSLGDKHRLLAISGTAALLVMYYFCWWRKRQSVSPVTLDGTTKIPLTLIDKKIISHDTRRFRFSLPSKDHTLGLHVGGFITVSTKLDGKLVVKPYTPVTSEDDKGYMDLIIKVYPDGKMSSYIDTLAIGDTLAVRGPSGKIRYHGKGVFEVEKGRDRKEKQVYKRIGMIAGGSGITPMLQIINDVIKRKDDTTEMSLLFSNKTVSDMLCADMLNELCECDQFAIHHTLSREEQPSGDMLKGRVDRSKIETCLPPPDKDTVILLCGPGGLIKETCIPILEDMGHNYLAF